jgi:hypothetical protein
MAKQIDKAEMRLRGVDKNLAVALWLNAGDSEILRS